MTVTAPASASAAPPSQPAGRTESGARSARRVSLGARVTWLAALSVAIAVALVSLTVFFTVSRTMYNQVDSTLKQRANNIVRSYSVYSQAGQIPAGLLSTFDVKMALINADGTVVFGYGPQNEPAISSTEEQVAAGTLAESWRTDAATNQRVYAVQYQNRFALVVAQSLNNTEATLGRLAIVLIAVSAAGILIAAVGGTLVARGTLGPVQRLTEAAERVAATGDLRSIPVSGDDELARLTQSFNSMLGALAQSQEQQRRLVADAGHELRTPLTSLRTNLELLIASRKPGAPQLSEEDTTELYADVRGQLDELTTLIGDLVELARQDSQQVVHEPVDLTEVVERALDRARRRGSWISFDVAVQPWTLLGDATALERAVLNLLDNAVKFSPPQGVVRVALRPLGDGTAAIEVADQGPGIAESDLPHVFDRFYRSSEARTLPGSGLGLSIVRHAAGRHGGAAYASNLPEGGALLTIRLPGRPG